MKPHKPSDHNGKRIKVGDLVRIIGVPDLSGMPQDGIVESLPVFQYLVGKYKRVLGFDDYGFAEFSFIMRHSDGERGWHSVWVEPFLLHIPQRRSNLFNLTVCALSVVVLAGGTPARAADTAEECSRPGVVLPIHEQLLGELNMARTHPDAYADFIAEKFASLSERNIYLEDGARIVMQEGRPAIDEAIDFLRHAEPVPPLRLSPCLVLAAQDHVRSQGPTGSIGHNGTDGSDPSTRAEKYLAGKAYCGENISYGKGSARDIMIQWLVDDGVPARGHRLSTYP